jgi:hypothetical protein
MFKRKSSALAGFEGGPPLMSFEELRLRVDCGKTNITDRP